MERKAIVWCEEHEHEEEMIITNDNLEVGDCTFRTCKKCGDWLFIVRFL